jgi:hypothetical protein
LVSHAIEIGTAGDVLKAWELLKSAVSLCPTNAIALGNLGYLHAIHGDTVGARNFLEKSLIFGPATMEPWVNLGNVFKEELEASGVTEGVQYQRSMAMMSKSYLTAYRLQPSVDVTANLAGLYAMEREWEFAALFAEKSLSIQFTEEAFCVLMKSLDNICKWEHPMRDMDLLISILTRNV